MKKLAYIEDSSKDRNLAENFTEFSSEIELSVHSCFEDALKSCPDFILMDLFMGLEEFSALERIEVLKDMNIPYAFISGADKGFFEMMKNELKNEKKFYSKPLSGKIINEILRENE